MKTRIEKDTMGQLEVPADKLWGAQTQCSIQNFPIGPAGSMPVEIVHAFGYLKKAHAENTSLKEAALELGILTEAQFDEWVVPAKMTGPS